MAEPFQSWNRQAKQKAKMQSVSDDDAWKYFLISHVLSWRRQVHSDWEAGVAEKNKSQSFLFDCGAPEEAASAVAASAVV